MGLRIVIVTFALLIDAFELLIEIAMTALGSIAGGAVAGCAAGAAIAGKVGCTVGGVAGGIIGLLAQSTGAGEVMGALLGYILDVCLSLSFGVLLVALLLFSGRLKGWNVWMYTVGLFVLKLIPLLGLAPGWTKYAWDCTGNESGVLEKARGNANAMTDGFTATPKARERQMRDIKFHRPSPSESYEQTA